MTAINSDVMLVEYFNDHWYKVTLPDGNSRYIPSVTTKIHVLDKPNLNRWRGDVGNREADMRMYEAGSQGKRIHWGWETILKGGAVIYDPWQNPVYTAEALATLKEKYGQVAVLRTQEEMIHINRLKQQFDILKPKVLGVEVKVFDLENNDAGTIDHVYEIEEGDYLIAGASPLYLEAGVYVTDLKSGSYVDDNVWLQLAPYGYMYEKMTGQKIAGALVSHTGSTLKRGIAGLKTFHRTREELLGIDYRDYRLAAALWERDHKDDQPHQFQFPSLITIQGEK